MGLSTVYDSIKLKIVMTFKSSILISHWTNLAHSFDISWVKAWHKLSLRDINTLVGGRDKGICALKMSCFHLRKSKLCASLSFLNRHFVCSRRFVFLYRVCHIGPSVNLTDLIKAHNGCAVRHLHSLVRLLSGSRSSGFERLSYTLHSLICINKNVRTSSNN